jgi:hypothetical protein
MNMGRVPRVAFGHLADFSAGKPFANPAGRSRRAGGGLSTAYSGDDSGDDWPIERGVLLSGRGESVGYNSYPSPAVDQCQGAIHADATQVESRGSGRWPPSCSPRGFKAGILRKETGEFPQRGNAQLLELGRIEYDDRGRTFEIGADDPGADDGDVFQFRFHGIVARGFVGAYCVDGPSGCRKEKSSKYSQNAQNGITHACIPTDRIITGFQQFECRDCF